MFQVQVFDLWLTTVDCFLENTTRVASYPNNSADIHCYITDETRSTYCGIAPGFDMKAKLSLSESVELAPKRVKNNNKVKM